MSIRLVLTQSFFDQIAQYFSLLSFKQAGQATCHCLTVNIPLVMEMPRIESMASYMQSMHSTTELHLQSVLSLPLY